MADENGRRNWLLPAPICFRSGRAFRKRQTCDKMPMMSADVTGPAPSPTALRPPFEIGWMSTFAAFARKEYDCVIKEREYYLFDLGMGVGALLLRAAELGLVAHPIAGFDPAAAKKALGIPDGDMIIALVIVGKKTEDLSALTPKQAEGEKARPPRLAPENVFAVDAYSEKLAARPQH